MRKKTGNRLWIGLAVLTMTLACLEAPERKGWPDNDVQLPDLPDTFEIDAVEAFDNGNSDTAEASFEAAEVKEAITETAEGESTTETNLPELPDTADVSDASSNEEAPDEETISEDLAIVESAEVIETSQHDPSAEDETSSAEDSPDTTTSEEITPAQPCLTNLALCNDGNLCTDDACDEITGCQNTYNTAPCDDGLLCTEKDHCSENACVGDPVNCDDGSNCTVDLCQPGVGCTYTWICECKNASECDDGNPCTYDYCQDGFCLYTHNLSACNDNNACTSNDLCSNGKCVGADFDYNDGNLCTDDSCDPAVGVTYIPNNAPCDDGNACTINDACQNSQCAAGPALNCNDDNACTSDFCNPTTGCAHEAIVCDDNNVCTDDSCEPTNGCKYTNNASDCDDNSVCTLIDKCESGVCVGSAPLDCDDGNECTLDICNKTLGCQHSKLSSTPCDNGDACTASDTCQNGTCQAGTQTCECYTTADCTVKEDGNFCNGTLVCDTVVMPHKCVLDPTTITICNASQDTACQKNTCQPASGKCEMIAVNEGGGCDDGNPCTATDVCQAGICFGISKPSGTVIPVDNFDDGDLNGWDIQTWNTCPNCNLCPCAMPSIQVTQESPYWVKIAPLAGSGHALLTSPKLFLPEGGTIQFLFTGATCGQNYSTCAVSTKGSLGGQLLGVAHPGTLCNQPPPSCLKQFTITTSGEQILIECTGISNGSYDPCGAVHLDDFAITCP